jgi:hypothetical protein
MVAVVVLVVVGKLSWCDDCWGEASEDEELRPE